MRHGAHENHTVPTAVQHENNANTTPKWDPTTGKMARWTAMGAPYNCWPQRRRRLGMHEDGPDDPTQNAPHEANALAQQRMAPQLLVEQCVARQRNARRRREVAFTTVGRGRWAGGFPSFCGAKKKSSARGTFEKCQSRPFATEFGRRGRPAALQAWHARDTTHREQCRHVAK